MKGILIIIDGFGLSKAKKGNAILAADTKNLDYYFNNYSFTKLKASGTKVGLPRGYQGSSEVGHINIGAGRVIKQDQVRINELLKKDLNNSALKSAIKNVKQNKSNLHIFGLLQDQGVHAHQNHLFKILNFCKENKISPHIHIFSDGRDTPPKSVLDYIKVLESKNIGKISSIMGRYYAMDRDNRWERIKVAYDALTMNAKKTFKNVQFAVKEAYLSGESDEFITPRMIKDFKKITDKDSVIFFNYRGDRARQISKAFVEPNFNKFKTKIKPDYVAMCDYYDNIPCQVILPKQKIKNTFGEYLSHLSKKQLRIAETEKYAHVTYFFSGEREKRFRGETRILIPSPKISTYDLKPEMSALKITNAVLKNIQSEKQDFIIMNLANCDMVGHTGDFKATIKAIETVDDCVGKIVNAARHHGYKAFITADHGNAENLLDANGNIKTAHTTAKVPFCIIDKKKYSLNKGKLGDVIPTILDIYKVPKLLDMTGNSLIKN